MVSIKKKFFFIFLLSYFIIGSVNSVNTGISFDEKHEQLNWNFHVELLNNVSKTIISDKKFDKKKFDQEVQSFVGYGIGFQIISQPIQFILKDFLINNNNITGQIINVDSGQRLAWQTPDIINTKE